MLTSRANEIPKQWMLSKISDTFWVLSFILDSCLWQYICSSMKLSIYFATWPSKQLGECILAVCNTVSTSTLYNSHCVAPPANLRHFKMPKNIENQPFSLQATKDSLLLLEHSSLSQPRALNCVIYICRGRERGRVEGVLFSPQKLLAKRWQFIPSSNCVYHE